MSDNEQAAAEVPAEAVDVAAEAAADAAPVKAPRKAKAPEVPAGYVLCRVLKAGDGKISTGEHVAGHGDLTYSRNDVFAVPRFQAEALELRGFVEFD